MKKCKAARCRGAARATFKGVLVRILGDQVELARRPRRAPPPLRERHRLAPEAAAEAGDGAGGGTRGRSPRRDSSRKGTVAPPTSTRPAGPGAGSASARGRPPYSSKPTMMSASSRSSSAYRCAMDPVTTSFAGLLGRGRLQDCAEALVLRLLDELGRSRSETSHSHRRERASRATDRAISL